MNSNNKRILLVIDDEVSTRMLIKDTLEDTGIRILESGYGEQAFELFQQYREKISLILLDICLPDIDGWLLIEKIRKIDQSIPVIAVSAILPYELESRYKQSGFTGYLSKPFSPENLKKIVLSHIHPENEK